MIYGDIAVLLAP